MASSFTISTRHRSSILSLGRLRPDEKLLVSRFFAPGSTGPVNYAGKELWLSQRVSMRPTTRIHVYFENYRTTPRQGLAISCASGEKRLRTNEQTSSGFTLWTDTAPKHVEVEYVAKRATDDLLLMNVWSLPEYPELRLSGINAAAMMVTPIRENEVRLACNDGYGLEEPTFTDLVVRVVFEVR